MPDSVPVAAPAYGGMPWGGLIALPYDAPAPPGAPSRNRPDGERPHGAPRPPKHAMLCASHAWPCWAATPGLDCWAPPPHAPAGGDEAPVPQASGSRRGDPSGSRPSGSPYGGDG